MSIEEQTVDLMCLSLTEDGTPYSLKFSKPSNPPHQLNGTVHCSVCNLDVPQLELITHIQGSQRWAVSAHRKRRCEPDVPSAIPMCVNGENYVHETYDDALARWNRTLQSYSCGQLVALEDADRYYCEKCRAVLVLHDGADILHHLRNPRHHRQPPTVAWLKELQAPGYSKAPKVDAKLERNLRKRVNCGTIATEALFGAPMSRVREHIQAQWKPGMSWQNYGSWHVDHITPVALFDTKDELQCRAMSHYTNLQPLWGHENLLKADHIA